MDLSKSWFAMAGDDNTQGGEGASATCIISRPNPINLYRGPKRPGENDFPAGPDFCTWAASVRTFCTMQRIASEVEMIVVAKNSLDPKYGSAYSIAHAPTNLESITNFESWLSHFRFLVEGTVSERGLLMQQLCKLGNARREPGEDLRWFYIKLCRLQREALLTAKHLKIKEPETAINLVAEMCFYSELPREFTIDSEWTGQSFRKNLDHVSLEGSKRLQKKGEHLLNEVRLRDAGGKPPSRDLELLPVNKFDSRPNFQHFKRIQESRENSSAQPRSKSKDTTCFHCNQEGHLRSECYYFLDEIGKRCIGCKMSGHGRKDCRNKENVKRFARDARGRKRGSGGQVAMLDDLNLDDDPKDNSDVGDSVRFEYI